MLQFLARNHGLELVFQGTVLTDCLSALALGDIMGVREQGEHLFKDGRHFDFQLLHDRPSSFGRLPCGDKRKRSCCHQSNCDNDYNPYYNPRTHPFNLL